MKEFIEKLIGRLEEYPHGKYEDEYGKGFSAGINASIEEVNELAEGYITTSTDISTTNADRIRSMTDEELAEFLDDLTDNCCRCAEHQNCGNCQIGLDAKTGFCDIKKWLQSEVEGVTENE